ncbi:MAG: serine/threonine-protein kinase, partial [Planctomycetota bacterium]
MRSEKMRADRPSSGQSAVIKELLDDFLEVPAAARPAAIAALERDHPDLASEVMELASTLDAADPDRIRPREPAPPVEAPSAIGREVGPYRLLEPIGEGGMATVYRAEQREPLARTVAVKILRAEISSAEIAARFEDERRVLARLEHPGIARILDAGETPEGRGFLVMEFVEGRPITEICQDERVPLSERVRAIIDIALALQHAHNRGVLHRDLKPSNLLAWKSERGVSSKVIDFGVAKLVSENGEPDIERTRAGQIIGTLEYMSPEQAGFGDAVVDARSDVFSLAAVTYELIAGDRPLRVEGSGVAALSSFLDRLGTYEPARPTSKLIDRSFIDLTTSTVQDVECIVLRALQRDPARRYATAAAFADDLERALAGRPVDARPPTWAYVAARFVARHRLLVASASTVLLSLLAGIAGVTFGLVQEKEHSRSLAAALAESDELVGSYADLLLEARADELGPETPLSEVVEGAARRIEEDEAMSAAARGRLAAAVGETLLDLEQPGRAKELLQLADELLGASESTKRLQRARGQALVRIGLIEENEGDFEAAEVTYGRALSIFESFVDGHGPKTSAAIVDIEERLAGLIDGRGDAMGAIPLQEDAIRRHEALGTDAFEMSDGQSSLAISLLHAGDYEGAAKRAKLALDARGEKLGASDLRMINPTRILADAYLRSGRGDEAVALLEELYAGVELSPKDPRHAILALSLASARHRVQAANETAKALRVAVANGERVFGGEPRFADRISAFRLEADLQDPDFDAGPTVSGLLGRMEERMGHDHPDLARARLAIGRALERSGRRELARPLLVDARDAIVRSNSERPPLADELDELLRSIDADLAAAPLPSHW